MGAIEVATASPPRHERRRTGVVIAALVLLALASAAAAVWVRWRAEPDSIRDRFVALLVWPDTVYAPDYSVAAFRSIEIGMSESEVLRRLGPPVRRSKILAHYASLAAVTVATSGEAHYAFYSVSPSDGSYWQRIIGYDATGIVRSITVGLRVD